VSIQGINSLSIIEQKNNKLDLELENDMMLNYEYPLYRPPSEAKSLIFQVTIGCSFNECSFCDMYRSKEYSEKSWDEVKMEIDMMAKQMPDTPRIFLAIYQLKI